MPQSGQLALFGDRIVKGVQLAVNDYNLQEPDNRVEWQIRDTEGSRGKGRVGLKDLARKSIVAGSVRSLHGKKKRLLPCSTCSMFLSCGPLLRGLALPSRHRGCSGMPSPSTARPDRGSICTRAKLKRFVILYPDEPYGKDRSTSLLQEFERKAEVLANMPIRRRQRTSGRISVGSWRSTCVLARS